MKTITEMKTMTKATLINSAIAAVAAMMATVSCTKDRTDIPPPGSGDVDGKVTVKATLAGFEGASASSPDTIRDLQACIFKDGKMTHVFDALDASGGSCSVSIDSHSGTLYMIANTDGVIDLGSLKSSDITEEQWLKTTVALQDGKPSDFFSGSVALYGMENSQTEIPLSLRRGAARFDLRFKTAGKAEVNSVTLSNAAESVFLFPVPDKYSPDDVTRNDAVSSFDSPLTEDTDGVLYVNEQSADNIVIKVDAVIDGKPEVLSKTISEPLKRNTVYTLTVRKDVIDVTLDVTFEDWEQGSDTELTPVVRYL